MDETRKITRLLIQPALKKLYAGAMLILAIDTALDACAAAVLDTSASNLIAQESQPMKRGHAEALMPLVARVMKASGVAFAELDRIAATAGPGSFTGLRVGLRLPAASRSRRTSRS
jgi:tRNA A37 threonylcarbamoyltransferase TsaD